MKANILELGESGVYDGKTTIEREVATDDIIVKTNTAERLRLKDNGDLAIDTDTFTVDSANDRVGINKAAPAVALDVVGAIAATGAVSGTTITGSGAVSGASLAATGAVTGASGAFTGALTADTDTLVADAENDRVGVNIAAPVGPFHVFNGPGLGALTRGATIQQGSTDAAGPMLRLLKTRADNTACVNNDYAGSFSFDFYNDAAQQTVGTSICSQVTDVADGTEDARLVISAMGAGALTEVARIVRGLLTVTGGLTATGAISGASLAATGAVTGASATITGSATAGKIIESKTAQTITAATDEVSCATSYVALDYDTGAITLSTNEIVDTSTAVDGQVLHIVNSGHDSVITLPCWVATTSENSKLTVKDGATSIALTRNATAGKADGITLIYNSTVGRWLQVN